METARHCAYNVTRDALLSEQVAAVSDTSEQEQLLAMILNGPGLDRRAAVWLKHAGPGLVVPTVQALDVAYLDEHQRVIEAFSSPPGSALPGIGDAVASVLIMADRRLAESGTMAGDRVRVCGEMEVAALVKASSRSAGEARRSFETEAGFSRPVSSGAGQLISFAEVQFEPFAGSLVCFPQPGSSQARFTEYFLDQRMQEDQAELAPGLALEEAGNLEAATEPVSRHEEIGIPEAVAGLALAEAQVEPPSPAPLPEFRPASRDESVPAPSPQGEEISRPLLQLNQAVVSDQLTGDRKQEPEPGEPRGERIRRERRKRAARQDLRRSAAKTEANPALVRQEETHEIADQGEIASGAAALSGDDVGLTSPADRPAPDQLAGSRELSPIIALTAEENAPASLAPEPSFVASAGLGIVPVPEIVVPEVQAQRVPPARQTSPRSGGVEIRPVETKTAIAKEKVPLGKRLSRWLSGEHPGRRKSQRFNMPGLVAFYWSGGAPKPHEIVNISHSGFYLRTSDLWLPNTLVRMTLQRPAESQAAEKESISVLARVVRVDQGGVGHEFVTTEALAALRSRDVLPVLGTNRKELDKFLESD